MHGRPRSNEKAKDSKKSLLRTIKYLKKYIPFILFALLLSIISNILYIRGPEKISEITNLIKDGLTVGIDMPNVKSIALTLIVLYLLSAICDYINAVTMATVAQKFTYNIRKDISEKINKLPLKYFDHTSYGDILSRITNDVDTLGQSLNQSISTLVSSSTLMLCALIMMLIQDKTLTMTAILSSIIGFAIMFVMLGKSQKYFSANQKCLGKLNGHIEEIYSGHSVIKVSNATEEVTKEFEKLNDNLFENNWKSQFISGMMHPLMGFIGNFGYVAVCVVGSYLVLEGQIKFGVIIAFMIYIRSFTQPLMQLAQSAQSLQSALAASERVFEFLDEEELQDESRVSKVLAPSKTKGEVEFKNVRFGYDKDKEIIKGFNANVKPGEKIAIVGPTGAGKTTMVNLLMRFYEMNSGDITIDGISIKDLTRENIHDLFCMVLQDTWVFDGTIKENIIYNTQDVTDKKVEEVCKIVGLEHFIKTLPEKYDTQLNENNSLSAGQKQLLTIARGMLKNSPLLILDEATSSVDTRTEELVQKAMDKLTEGKTSFIIAHRLSTIKNANLILVVDKGNIVEQGTHEELLKKNGFYAKLYNAQFDKIN